jgi:hypothetical protein
MVVFIRPGHFLRETTMARDLALEHRHWEAIASGFGLPFSRVGHVWICFWRRSAARCGRVGEAFNADGYFCEGWRLPSKNARPNFPWFVPDAHQLVMLKAASAEQTRRRTTNQQCTWLDALALCEQTLDVEIEHWLAGMQPACETDVRGWLSTWAAAREPVAILQQWYAEQRLEQTPWLV